MALNTSTFGQLPPKAPVATDIFAVQFTDGLNYSSTGTEVAQMVGNIPIDRITLTKVTIPDDPEDEELVMYLKEIDANNNGLYVKIKEAGVITEKLVTLT